MFESIKNGSKARSFSTVQLKPRYQMVSFHMLAAVSTAEKIFLHSVDTGNEK